MFSDKYIFLRSSSCGSKGFCRYSKIAVEHNCNWDERLNRLRKRKILPLVISWCHAIWFQLICWPNTMATLMLLSPSGFCRLIPHTRSPGTWTIYFEGADYESHLSHENAELVSINWGHNDEKWIVISWQAIVLCIKTFNPY